MSRALESAVSIQIIASQRRPALLFQIGLGSGTTLYYNNTLTNITFGGIIYTAKSIKLSKIKTSSEGQINKINLTIDNITGNIFSYINTFKFRNNSLIINRIYLGDIGNPAYYIEHFRGTMEEPENMSQEWITIPAYSGKVLENKTLSLKYTKACQLMFSDSKTCNRDGFSDLTNVSMFSTGTVASGSTNYLIMPTPGVAGVTGTNDDAFKYGKVQIGKNGVTYDRMVSSYISGTSRVNWNVGIPNVVDNTYQFIVYKGCPKTWEACSSAYAYGPSGNNTDNFLGFQHIGNKKYAF